MKKLNGFYLISKEKGWTSFDVCAKIKKLKNIKRVGHTGTLDPFATGLLIIAIGKATKFIPFLEKARKTYETEILLGKTSETLDPESEIVDCDFQGKIPEISEVETILSQNFSGKISQTPPQYSAIKINGKRAYDLARKGETFEMKSRETEIFSAKILDYDFPLIKIELEVSAGFYVRSFANEFGKVIAKGGMCISLKRTKINHISLTEAQNLEEISIPLDPKHLLKFLPQKEIPVDRLNDFQTGRSFPFSGAEEVKILCLIDGKTIGLGETLHEKLQPRIVL